MPRNFDAIVIGSGLGGLTAGALYARAGHRVLLLERNGQFGGAATTYQHGALTIEASLHETTSPHDTKDPKSQIFQALDIMDDIDFVPVGVFYEVRSPLLGEPFVLPHGLDAAEQALIQRFAQHTKSIRELFRRLHVIRDTMAMFMEKHDGLWWFLHTPTLPLRLWSVLRDSRKSLAAVFQRLFGDDERIKIALAANLAYYADDPDQLWWLMYAVAQSGYIAGGGYYIHGGSRRLSDRLVKIIEEEGGIAEANRTVVRILLDENGHACGVEHESTYGGESQIDQAPVLFGNAAPHVLAKTLPARVQEAFMAPYANKPLSLSLFSIALGLNRRPREFGVKSYSTYLLPEWMTSLSSKRENAKLLSRSPGEKMPSIVFVDYSVIDSGINEQSPFLASITGLDHVDNWAGLTKEQYDQRRNEWMEAIIKLLDNEFPGLASAVVQKEMATARTMQEYLNTPDGALYGFAQRPPEHLPLKGPERTPKTTIEGLWLASAFAGSGGYTGAMMSGATAARLALAHDKPFKRE